jgi:hypothetical protein
MILMNQKEKEEALKESGVFEGKLVADQSAKMGCERRGRHLQPDVEDGLMC